MESPSLLEEWDLVETPELLGVEDLVGILGLLVAEALEERKLLVVEDQEGILGLQEGVDLVGSPWVQKVVGLVGYLWLLGNL